LPPNEVIAARDIDPSGNLGNCLYSGATKQRLRSSILAALGGRGCSFGGYPRSSIAEARDVKLTWRKKCTTQSFPVVCDSPSPGTSWRNRENPAPRRAHVSAM